MRPALRSARTFTPAPSSSVREFVLAAAAFARAPILASRALAAVFAALTLAPLFAAMVFAGPPPSASSALTRLQSPAITWPSGTDTCSFENVEGIVIVRAECSTMAGADTIGPFVLDTGAGYLALDAGLAHWLGLEDSAGADPIRYATRALPRLKIGDWTRDQVQPVLLFDADVARRVTDRPVLGLLGQQLVADRVVWIDYQDERLAFLPAEPARDASSDITDSRAALGITLDEHAAPIRFRLLGDGKVVVRGRVGRADARPLTLIVDTGSTKTVLFADSLAAHAPESRHWKAVAGVSAPTLFGDAAARMARVPWLRLEDARDPRDAASESAGEPVAGERHGAPANGRRDASDSGGGVSAPASQRDGAPIAELHDSDAALLDGQLQRILAADIGEPVHGLLGYSFLRHFHVAIDFPRRVLWLDPLPEDVDERPYEYCHVGLQLERRGADVVVAGVLDGSPAARAGIRVGDVLVSLDGDAVARRDVIETTRALEGAPGTHVTVTLRHGGVTREYRLTRKRLL
jgi:predicted aspartyl protease